jgi:hypothetical protein
MALRSRGRQAWIELRRPLKLSLRFILLTLLTQRQPKLIMRGRILRL